MSAPDLITIPHELLDALAEAAGVEITDVRKIVMLPGSLTFHLILRDQHGFGVRAGDFIARAKVTYPISDYTP